MDLDARKPVFGVCEQQRYRPDCASAQPDQRLYYSLSGSIISRLTKGKLSRFQLVSVAEQDGLNLILPQTPEDSFSHVEAQYYYGGLSESSLLISAFSIKSPFYVDARYLWVYSKIMYFI